jgi:DNA-binding PadR family transcriptional regulator
MDTEYEILAVLWEGPRPRSEILASISERNRGLEARASSVYPSLQVLEDGDFLRVSVLGEKRLYSLTGKGSDLLAERAALNERGAPSLQDADSPIARGMTIVRMLAGMARHIASNKFAR